MSDVFDNLIIHLCKFSTLVSAAEREEEEKDRGDRKKREMIQERQMTAWNSNGNVPLHKWQRPMVEVERVEWDLLEQR